jgi:CTP:molybdopterin cytidylyltransferase MocA
VTDPGERAGTDPGERAGVPGGHVAGLLLAAGAGRRFGGPKALAAFRGRLLVEHALGVLTAGGCAPRYVVLGAAAGQVLAAADLGGAAVVRNEAWESGMGSSLRAGLAALPAGVGAVVVCLVDQPNVGPEAVRRLAAAYAGGARAAVATYGGAPRNPVLLARDVWSAAAADAVGDRGARAFLRAHPELVSLVPCDGTGTPDDADTVADLARLAAAGPAR